MPEIKSFPFNKNSFYQIKSYKFGRNWPVVYILKNTKELYIGETVNVYYRSKQHYENIDRQRLTDIHIITDEEYNKSATLDIESWLIQYMSAEGTYKLQNGNGGLQDHNYYDREKYKTKFELIWEQLKTMSLVKKDLTQIRNSDIFKYSPYKALTEDQITVVGSIFKNIKMGVENTYIINGKPGTGKTILAIYLIKYLKDKIETKNLNIALVIPMTSLRVTLKKVFSSINGLKASMVIGPNDVTKDNYDLLIVDEAHRLKRRINITNYRSFDKTNAQLGLGNTGNELDWILKSSKSRIFFYDKNQSIKPTDVRSEMFSQLNAIRYDLTSQMRVCAGEDYIHFIDDIFNLRDVSHYNFDNYDFEIYDDIHKMVADIKRKDAEFNLCRVVAGYAWPWKTKNGGEYDIEIDGLKLDWNSTAQDWVNSKNALNEVGCIHTVQGYDLNYVGVIIGPELSYDEINKKLVVDSKKYMDFNGKRSISDPLELERYIINIYKTLLARGIKGTYVYISDDKLRKCFNNKLGKSLVAKDLRDSANLRPVTGFINVPLFSSVGCGELMFADSTVQELIPVDSKYISKGSKYFILETSGDSMNNVGINNGDFVLCKKNYHPTEGDIVIALIGDDATIKEFHREKSAIILKPQSSNPKHTPLRFEEGEEIVIQGVFVRVLRKNNES